MSGGRQSSDIHFIVEYQPPPPRAKKIEGKRENCVSKNDDTINIHLEEGRIRIKLR
jgi:hypothetical protein